VCSLLCIFFLALRRHLGSPLFPYTTLFRSRRGCGRAKARPASGLRRRTLSPFRYRTLLLSWTIFCIVCFAVSELAAKQTIQKMRSEEHTSELQSRGHLVCRLLLEKKNKTQN